MNSSLKFGHGNSKLVDGQIVFDLPAGWSCPFAKECLAKANRDGSGLTDGPDTRFRCFAASLETVFRGARENRWNNFETLKGKSTAQMTTLIGSQLPFGSLYRIHSSGDFYSQAYFDAWCAVARMYPERVFYAYTKALPFWVARLDAIPSNMRLTASYGGTHDHLIKQHGLKYALVVNWESQADALGLEIDHDDSHAWNSDKPFALLIHGTQKPGTDESKAWQFQKTQKRMAMAA